MHQRSTTCFVHGCVSSRELRQCACCVPFWNVQSRNVFQIGIMCRSEKCAILKHASYWHCANLVISKPHVKCKVLKHKNLCKETKRPIYCIFVFVIRLRQLGCPIARGNHFLVWATVIYIILARPGKFKSEVSLHQSYHLSYKHQISYLN